jgi:hypothetical protein
MLLDHDDVDCLGILESEESKSSGPSGTAVPHNSALNYFAKLLEIVS